MSDVDTKAMEFLRHDERASMKGEIPCFPSVNSKVAVRRILLVNAPLARVHKDAAECALELKH